MTLIRNTRGGAYEAAELSRRAKTTCDGEVAVADEMSSYLLSGEPRRGAKWIVCLEINKAISTTPLHTCGRNPRLSASNYTHE